MKILKIAVVLVLMAALAALAGCQQKVDTAGELVQQLSERWQLVNHSTPTREECEAAFASAVLGGQEIVLPEAEQYDLITCGDPDTQDENITILVSGSASSLADFVKGMGFEGYNVEYRKDEQSEDGSVYQWKSEKNGDTCTITITAAPGPLEIQVERVHT